jgi:hypothetical protein
MVDPMEPRSGKCNEFLMTASAALLQEPFECSSWPGTQLFDTTSVAYQYEPHKFRELAKRLSSGVYDWTLPDLPDDMAFLRNDESLIFGSIAHERDAFLELSGVEFASLTKAVPQLDLRVD